MPNAHRECNSLGVVFEPAQSPDIGAIASKSARNGPRTVADLTGRGFREPGRPAYPAYSGAIRVICRISLEGSRSVRHDGAVAIKGRPPFAIGWRPIHPRLPAAPGTD